VDEGYVTVSLNLSAMPDLPTGFSSCTNGGMSYHIHELWEHTDDDDSVDCGSENTGGHWDPWQACGGASGNQYCGSAAEVNATDDVACIFKDEYAPDFSSGPFSVEVGDWSGKYDKLMLDDDYMISRTDSSFFEVSPEEMEGFSVVFHCNDGKRAFCAPFVESSTETTETIPNQEYMGTDHVKAEFDVLSDESAITIFRTGEVKIVLDATATYTDSSTDGCENFEYGVFEAGSVTLDASALGADCDDAVGDFYDPTHQCPSFSGSEYCADGFLCDDADYVYDCDFEGARYSCAPGDLSGKFGVYMDPATETLDLVPTGGTLTPPTSELSGKVMAIYCAEADQTELTVFACAPIEPFSTSTTEEPSGVGHVSLVIGAMVSVVAAMW